MESVLLMSGWLDPLSTLLNLLKHLHYSVHLLDFKEQWNYVEGVSYSSDKGVTCGYLEMLMPSLLGLWSYLFVVLHL